MSITITSVLSAICSRVESLPSQQFQQIFMLSNEKEARLACDVLLSQGFVAKLYHDDKDGSRLYVSQPSPEMAVEPALAAALSYAHMLKTVQSSLEALHNEGPAGNPDYRISITSLADNDKTISIHLSTKAKIKITPEQTKPKAASPNLAALSKSAPKQVSTARKKPADQHDKFMHGPQITRESWLAQLSNPNKPDGFLRQMKLYITGNSASAAYILGIIFIVMLCLYSLLVLSKGYLCPDFIVTEKNKNQAWYCTRI